MGPTEMLIVPGQNYHSSLGNVGNDYLQLVVKDRIHTLRGVIPPKIPER